MPTVMDDKTRLERFEALLAETKEEYEQVDAQIESLKAVGKTRTATFKQLLARKLTLKQFLDMFERHDLV